MSIRDNPSFGNWNVNWDDKAEYYEAMGYPKEPDSEYFLREEDSTLDIVEKMQVLDNINYKVKEVGTTRGKQIFLAKLSLGELSISFKFSALKNHP